VPLHMVDVSIRRNGLFYCHVEAESSLIHGCRVDFPLNV